MGRGWVACGLTVLAHRMVAEAQAASALAALPAPKPGTRDVSFLAFRGPSPREATGAHVHIGEPSPRRASRAG